jgi:hypothetical protein
MLIQPPDYMHDSYRSGRDIDIIKQSVSCKLGSLFFHKKCHYIIDIDDIYSDEFQDFINVIITPRKSTRFFIAPKTIPHRKPVTADNGETSESEHSL